MFIFICLSMFLGFICGNVIGVFYFNNCGNNKGFILYYLINFK